MLMVYSSKAVHRTQALSRKHLRKPCDADTGELHARIQQSRIALGR